MAHAFLSVSFFNNFLSHAGTESGNPIDSIH
jgi:hypothetical protein